jgi:hypothetical protein
MAANSFMHATGPPAEEALFWALIAYAVGRFVPFFVVCISPSCYCLRRDESALPLRPYAESRATGG